MQQNLKADIKCKNPFVIVFLMKKKLFFGIKEQFSFVCYKNSKYENTKIQNMRICKKNKSKNHLE